MTAYYNDNDPFCVAWLRRLIEAGELPAGIVDDRSFHEIKPKDIQGFSECHFFAGIGGWPLAFRLAGWTGRGAWSASLPCQPLSSAGRQKGHVDERHVWPAFHDLLAECKPATIVGEQVASSLGREWFSGVRADMEGMGYACGAADLCSAGVGAPHIRQRLHWLAHSDRERGRSAASRREAGGRSFREPSGLGIAGRLGDAAGSRPFPGAHDGIRGGTKGEGTRDGEPERYGDPGWLADADLSGAARQREHGRAGPGAQSGLWEGSGGRGGPGARGMADADRAGCAHEPECDAGEETRLEAEGGRDVVGRGDIRGLDDAERKGLEGLARHGDDGHESRRLDALAPRSAPAASGARNWSRPWERFEVVHCSDGKARRFEPGSFPLAHGVSNRVGRLRGYGNAINPWLAAEFLKAVDEALAQLAGGVARRDKS